MSERFKKHPEFKSYWVSTLGRVRGPKGIVRFHLVSGYPTVSIWEEGVGWKRRAVHRMVLETWVGPCPPRHEGAHRDGNRLNNRLKNLRWRTRSQNNQEKWSHGTAQAGERGTAAKLSLKQVKLIRKLYATGDTTQRKLAKEFKVVQRTICCIVNNITWYEGPRHA